MLRESIQTAIAQKPLSTWQSIFEKLDVCVEPVLSFDEIASHPHFQARGLFVELASEQGSKQRQLANPLKFSDLKPVYRYLGVAKGQHDCAK